MSPEIALIVGSVENLLWAFVTVAQVVLLLRLWESGLWKIYRFFFGFLAVDVVRTGVLFFLPYGTDAYGWAFLSFIPLTSLCALLAIVEIYSLVFRGYKGIGTLSRWVITGGLVLAGGIAVLTAYPDFGNRAEAYPILLHFFVLQRAVDSALLLFLLFVTLFLVWFPVPLSRNVILHTIVFGAAFASQALLLLIRDVAGNAPTHLLSTVSLAAEALCLLAWIFFLTKEGERKPVVFGHRWRLKESERLVAQLDTINSSLIRLARK